MSRGPIWVVAGALQGLEDTWLMHRRPLEKHHGGLWEFPGGKVEPFEKPIESLIRELSEELAIIVRAEDCEPVGFAEERGEEGEEAIVILLYKIRVWSGEPRACEGGRIGWFSPDSIDSLAKPPLDYDLTQQLFGKA